MSLIHSGTPFTGYVSLTNGAPGPVAFALFVNGAAYAVPATERLYITSIMLSSDDTALALVTVDDGVLNARKLASAYLGATLPPLVDNLPPGACRLQFAQTPRATAAAVTAGKTVECTIKGYVART